MKTHYLCLITCAGCALLSTARAQETNGWSGPLTRLEAMQTNVGKVIIKATSPVGTLSIGAGVLTVSYKEFRDISLGTREYGIAIGINDGGRQCDTLIDYDEIDSLLNASDYLNRFDRSATSLPLVDAFYNTKDGFRIVAFSSRHTSNMEIAVRSLRFNTAPIFLSRTELSRLRSYIVEAKTKLDTLRVEK